MFFLEFFPTASGLIVPNSDLDKNPGNTYIYTYKKFCGIEVLCNQFFLPSHLFKPKAALGPLFSIGHPRLFDFLFFQ